MHVHFVAVAGTGMGSLAGLFKAAGHRVTGSDVHFYPPMGPALESWGIELFEGFDARHLDPAPDLVVIGNVCRPWNVEAKAAIDGGLRTISMAHALAEHLLTHRAPLVVGGTHGKTTTSSMCAHILLETGFEPGFLIGGISKSLGTSFRLPGPKRLTNQAHRKTPFIVEGDEYDTAFFEKTPKFWHYRPEVGIVTSVEHDHIDIYPDAEVYQAAFEGFAERVDPKGLLVLSAHDAKVRALAERSQAEVCYYALSTDDTGSAPPHWMGAVANPRGEFDLFAGGVFAGRVNLRVPGEHNIRNAIAALAATCQGYGVELTKAIDAIGTFEGVKRRQELLFEARSVQVFDDFAHHPTAVRETLHALRALRPEGKLIAVFEPRSATACRSLHQAEYVDGFAGADRVIFAPLGRSDIDPAERLDLEALAKALEARGVRATAAPSVDAIVDDLKAEARPGDTIALLSNGAFGGIYDKLRVALAQ